MLADQIAQVRRFNRLVAQRIGALDDRYLGRGRALGASRLLYEVGERGANLRDLRLRLGLDAGYASRLAKGLAKEGLLRLGRRGEDQRVRELRLTPAGRREIAEMNARSDRLAGELLGPLSPRQRESLVTAMAQVHRLLRAAGLRIERVDPASRTARWCVAQYFAELGRRFENGFDPSASLRVDDRDLVPPHGVFLLASVDGEPVGCGSVKPIASRVGYLKRMWVAESARGLGVGRRLLEALEDQSLALGYRTLRLETNRALREAIALYRSAGYRVVRPFNDEPYAHLWFEKRLRRGAGYSVRSAASGSTAAARRAGRRRAPPPAPRRRRRSGTAAAAAPRTRRRGRARAAGRASASQVVRSTSRIAPDSRSQAACSRSSCRRPGPVSR